MPPWSSNELQRLHNMIGYQDNSFHNGHQVTCPIMSTTVESRYDMVSFLLLNTHRRYHIAHLWAGDMWYLSWFQSVLLMSLRAWCHIMYICSINIITVIYTIYCIIIHDIGLCYNKIGESTVKSKKKQVDLFVQFRKYMETKYIMLVILRKHIFTLFIYLWKTHKMNGEDYYEYSHWYIHWKSPLGEPMNWWYLYFKDTRIFLLSDWIISPKLPINFDWKDIMG